MKPLRAMILAVLALGTLGRAHAFTLSFDDIRYVGEYWSPYGVIFMGGFSVADQRGSTWGPPHSGSKVLRYSSGIIPGAAMKFSYPIGEQGIDGEKRFTIYSLGAYFSTEPGAALRFTAYDTRMNTVAVADIGSAGGSWNNVYVQLSSPDGLIAAVMLEGISSPDAVRHFAADDMTIVPTPEPSSLLALGGGLAALGIPLIRRRRERER